MHRTWLPFRIAGRGMNLRLFWKWPRQSRTSKESPWKKWMRPQRGMRSVSIFFKMVPSTGIEPVFPASEASGLSVNLRGHMNPVACPPQLASAGGSDKRNRHDCTSNEKSWSGIRESNSRLKLGKLAYYHCTNPACAKENLPGFPFTHWSG